MDAAADTADGGHRARYLLHGHPLEEFLKAAELGDVQAGDVDLALIVEPDRDLGMPFNAGDRVNRDGLRYE